MPRPLKAMSVRQHLVPNREPKTAAELLRELEADPEWVAARDERERQLSHKKRFYAAAQTELVSEIRSLGYDVESVWDLVNNSPHPVLERRFTGPYPLAYPVLVRHLGVSHLPKVREGIIRALSVSDASGAAKPALLREFSIESNPELRWVLALALSSLMSAAELSAHPSINAVLDGSGT